MCQNYFPSIAQNEVKLWTRIFYPPLFAVLNPPSTVYQQDVKEKKSPPSGCLCLVFPLWFLADDDREAGGGRGGVSLDVKCA